VLILPREFVELERLGAGDDYEQEQEEEQEHIPPSAGDDWKAVWTLR
jgi:hypothetical protein